MSIYIIAEGGINHNGDYSKAIKMVDVAKNSGADAIKFQSFISNKIISKKAKKAKYQKINTNDFQESQLEMVKKFELSFEKLRSLKKYADKKNIEFLLSPFDIESLQLIKNLKLKKIKIPSGEINNGPFLIEIAKSKIPLIISTGMANLKEVEECLEYISYGLIYDKKIPITKKILQEAFSKAKKNNILNKNVSLLHCTSEYPCPYNEVNLKTIKTLKNKFKLNVGYSDHTLGIEIPIAACAMGAQIIEKHFTLDRKLSGPDHLMSLEPIELKKMVNCLRNLELAIGDGVKKPSKSEVKNIKIVRKSIVASCTIDKGDFFTEKNITFKRPGTGISPNFKNKIIGTRAKKIFKEDDIIEI